MTDHLDAEIVAAWLDGSLDAAERAQAEAHAADCDRCRAVLAAMIRTEPPPARGFFSLTPARWLVPLATAALVLLAWNLNTYRNAQNSFVQNPPVQNPPVQNPPVQNPPVQNPSVQNPSVQNPTVQNPTVQNPSVQNQPVQNRRPAEKRRQEHYAQTPPPPPPTTLAESVTVEKPSASRVRAEESVMDLSAHEVVSPDPQVRWRFGAKGQIQRSSDGGKTWAAIAFPEKVDITSLAAPNSVTAIVTLADGRRFTTADAGKTWTLNR